MAISQRIQYDDSEGSASGSTHGSAFISPKVAMWWPAYPPVQPSELTYVGIPMQRGIKVAPLIDADISSGIGMIELKGGQRAYREYQSVFRKVLGSIREGEFLCLASPAADDLAVASASELSEILSVVNDLAFQVEEDEYGLVRPSYHAHRQCMRILLLMAQSSDFIKPSDVGTDRNGAIRIAWTNEGREAELICPSEETELPYLYFSSEDSYGTETDITPTRVIEKIRWTRSG